MVSLSLTPPLTSPSLHTPGDVISAARQVRGALRNTGHDVTFSAERSRPVNISGGPLSYPYTFEKLQLHFGLVPDDWRRSPWKVAGSEHVVNGQRFPAEVGGALWRAGGGGCGILHRLSHG